MSFDIDDIKGASKKEYAEIKKASKKKVRVLRKNIRKKKSGKNSRK